MVSSAPSIPGYRNIRIRRCGNAPLKMLLVVERKAATFGDLAVLEGKLDAHSALFRAAGVKAAVGHLVSCIEQRRFSRQAHRRRRGCRERVKTSQQRKSRPRRNRQARNRGACRGNSACRYRPAICPRRALVGEPLKPSASYCLCVVCAADIVDRAAQPPVGERARVELSQLKRSEPCKRGAQQNQWRKQGLLLQALVFSWISFYKTACKMLL